MATEHDTSTDSTRSTMPREQFAVEMETPEDLAMVRLHQAWAVSATLCGEGYDSFMLFNREIQRNTLWALCALIGDAKTALHRAQTER